jgi:hypothetical protein
MLAAAGEAGEIERVEYFLKADRYGLALRLSFRRIFTLHTRGR